MSFDEDKRYIQQLITQYKGRFWRNHLPRANALLAFILNARTSREIIIRLIN
jgi:hypothetical protein